MSQSQLKKYVLTYLADELAEVRARGPVIPPIDEYESAIILRYTNDGYVDLNEDLRLRPEKLSEFSEHLRNSLSKLPSYKGLVYRGVTLTARQLKLYEDHLASGLPLRELPFLSTSRRRTVAMQFGIKPLFVIRSKTGKLIENYAKYGTGSPYNESEVIFLNNSIFIVADISKENERMVITMFEL